MMSEEKLEYNGIDLSRLAEALDMWKDGKIDREVAEAMDIPVVYVASIRKMLGISPNYKHAKSREKRHTAELMHKDGMDVADIARILRIPKKLAAGWVGVELEEEEVTS